MSSEKFRDIKHPPRDVLVKYFASLLNFELMVKPLMRVEISFLKRVISKSMLRASVNFGRKLRASVNFGSKLRASVNFGNKLRESVKKYAHCILRESVKKSAQKDLRERKNLRAVYSYAQLLL